MAFFTSAPLFSRADILGNRNLVPATPGVYAWFFKGMPAAVPTNGCDRRDDYTLLYIGISPKDSASRQNLRKRIVYHLRGNAAGSTLRQTLGVLLAEQSEYPLRIVGSGERVTLTHAGEQWLDAWMANNARVCWISQTEPWKLEQELLQNYSLPLNIQHNRHHPFCRELLQLRQKSKTQARQMGIVHELGSRMQSPHTP